jgi:antitoxin (DNA-binding transcriptional repressor) of toxin-antitoxin stability system
MSDDVIGVVSTEDFDKVATGSYIKDMEIGVKEAKNHLTDLLRRVEAGEAVTITRDGVAVVDLVKHVPKWHGPNWDGFFEYKRKNGIGKVVGWIADDFDDPLPEDFLITPNAEKLYLARQALKKP